MARPRKCKKVCCLPKNNRFGPLDTGEKASDIITMTVDEYETIRLIDLEGLTQEECAEKMDVARTTIQRIYFEARGKLAQSLVNGGRIHIEGGDYILCEEREPQCRCEYCYKRRYRQNGSPGK